MERGRPSTRMVAQTSRTVRNKAIAQPVSCSNAHLSRNGKCFRCKKGPAHWRVLQYCSPHQLLKFCSSKLHEPRYHISKKHKIVNLINPRTHTLVLYTMRTRPDHVYLENHQNPHVKSVPRCRGQSPAFWIDAHLPVGPTNAERPSYALKVHLGSRKTISNLQILRHSPGHGTPHLQFTAKTEFQKT